VDLEVPQWRRIDPASVWVNTLPQAWRYISGFWWIALIALYDGSSLNFGFSDLLILFAIFLSGLVSSAVHYMTLRFRFFDGKLEIRQGLINKRSRVIDPKRIQNIELVRNPFHRIAGLVELRIETAGESREEGLLSALNEESAAELKAQLESCKDVAVDTENIEQADVDTSIGELIAYGLSSKVTGVAVIMWLIASDVLTRAGYSASFIEDGNLSPVLAVSVIVLSFAVAWLVAVGIAIIKHWNHQVFFGNNGLTTLEGLFTKKRVEMALTKVQMVIIHEPFLRRLMGFGTVSIETAGVRMRGRAFHAEAKIPMVARGDLSTLLNTTLPSLSINPWKDNLKRIVPAGLKYEIVVRVLMSLPLIISGALWVAFSPKDVAFIKGISGMFFVSVLAAVFFYTIFKAYVGWRYKWWQVSGDHIVAKSGWLGVKTRVMAVRKIQAVHVEQGPMLRLFGLVKVHVRVADSSLTLPLIGFDEAEAIVERITPKYTAGILE
jgi:putative membrane protein